MKTKCIRCAKNKTKAEFILDSQLKDVCRPCFRRKEIVDYIQPPITKAMSDLEPKEKQLIIKRLIDDYKKKERFKESKQLSSRD